MGGTLTLGGPIWALRSDDEVGERGRDGHDLESNRR